MHPTTPPWPRHVGQTGFRASAVGGKDRRRGRTPWCVQLPRTLRPSVPVSRIERLFSCIFCRECGAGARTAPYPNCGGLSGANIPSRLCATGILSSPDLGALPSTPAPIATCLLAHSKARTTGHVRLERRASALPRRESTEVGGACPRQPPANSLSLSGLAESDPPPMDRRGRRKDLSATAEDSRTASFARLCYRTMVIREPNQVPTN